MPPQTRQAVDWFGGDVDVSIPSATRAALVPYVPLDDDRMDHNSAVEDAVGAWRIASDIADSCGGDGGTHSVVV